jgi:hypothetical protein
VTGVVGKEEDGGEEYRRGEDEGRGVCGPVVAVVVAVVVVVAIAGRVASTAAKGSTEEGGGSVWSLRDEESMRMGEQVTAAAGGDDDGGGAGVGVLALWAETLGRQGDGVKREERDFDTGNADEGTDGPAGDESVDEEVRAAAINEGADGVGAVVNGNEVEGGRTGRSFVYGRLGLRRTNDSLSSFSSSSSLAASLW